MSEEKKNKPPVQAGIIYAKPVKSGISKKNDKPYEIKSIILEIKNTFKGKTKIELPEFQLGWGVNIDGFEINDPVEITYIPTGREVSASFHKTELKALYIRHSDIDSGLRDVGGEAFPRKEKEIFVPPNPYEDSEPEDLPF